MTLKKRECQPYANHIFISGNENYVASPFDIITYGLRDIALRLVLPKGSLGHRIKVVEGWSSLDDRWSKERPYVEVFAQGSDLICGSKDSFTLDSTWQIAEFTCIKDNDWMISAW